LAKAVICGYSPSKLRATPFHPTRAAARAAARQKNQESEIRIRQGHSHPKAYDVAEEVGNEPAATSAARAPRIAAPGTAPQHA
jgi:hypothetical protein